MRTWSPRQAKVLYRVDATLLMRLLAAPVGPSDWACPSRRCHCASKSCSDRVPGAAVRRDRPDGTTSGRLVGVQRNLWLRHSVFRRLVDDPVLYFDDLTAEERAYLASPTGRQLLRRAAEQAGFELEERAEGILLVDTDGIATDCRFPDDAAPPRWRRYCCSTAGSGPRPSSSCERGAAALLEPVPALGQELPGRGRRRHARRDAWRC